MNIKLKQRRGFSLIEMVTVTVLFSIIVIGVLSSTKSVSELRAKTRDSVYLSVHNLNVMESLEKECREGATLLSYYNDDKFSTSQIRTEVFVIPATCSKYHVYEVKVSSKEEKSRGKKTDVFVLTDIGNYKG